MIFPSRKLLTSDLDNVWEHKPYSNIYFMLVKKGMLQFDFSPDRISLIIPADDTKERHGIRNAKVSRIHLMFRKIHPRSQYPQTVRNANKMEGFGLETTI